MSTPDQHPAPALSRGTAIGTITLTLLGWSSIPLFLKFFTDKIDPWTANGWRYTCSALIWLPILLLHYRRGTTPRGLWKAAFLPSCFNALGQALFALAPYYIDPGLMTFSLRLQIVFVSIGAATLFPLERALLRRPAFLVGLVTVVLATLFTVAARPGAFESVDATDHKTIIGVLCAVGSGFFYACYAITVRRQMSHLPAFTAFAAVSQWTAVFLLVPMLLFAKDFGVHALDLSGRDFFLLILSAVIGIGLGHTLYFYSIARLGLAVSSGVVQLQPIIVSLASMLIFKEALSTGQWIGGAVAVSGAIWMLVVQHRVAASMQTPR